MWFSTLIGLLLIFFSTNRSIYQFEKRLVPPPPQLHLFTFGYGETVADLLWLRVIQDIERCELLKTEVKSECQSGWAFQMFWAIGELAQDWSLPFRVGGTILSVAVDDIEGASRMFDLGVARFPADFGLNYAAAYHAIYEEKKPDKAARLLIRAAENGGPGWFYSLAAKLYTEAGQKELGIGVLEAALKEPHTEEAKARIEWRLKQLKGEEVDDTGPLEASRSEAQ